MMLTTSTTSNNKYGNKRVQEDGYSFDSKAECARYYQLKLMQRAGEISALHVHPSYELQPAFKDRDGKIQRAICYEPDFAYIEDNKLIAEDVKGHETQSFQIKRKMFLYHHRDIELRVLKV